MRTQPLFLLLLPLAIAACSADAGIDPEDPNTADPGDPNVEGDPAEEPGDGDGTTTVDQALSSGLIDAEEAAFLGRINQYRRANGRPSLRISVALSRAAHAHSVDMANYNYFSHTSRDGRTFDQRIRAAGYTYNTPLSENLAAGSASAAATFEQWRTSSGHNANMLNGNFRVIGIARAYNAGSSYGWYWTTTFGGYIDAVTSHGVGTILSNGGFEAAPAGTAWWNGVRTRGNWYTTRATRSATSPHAGRYQITQSDPDPGGASVTQIVLGAPGIAYTLSAMSRRTAGSSPQFLYLEFLNGSYARVGVASARAAAGSSWGAARVSGVAPNGTRFVRAFLHGSGSAGTRSTFAFDSVRLTAE